MPMTQPVLHIDWPLLLSASALAITGLGALLIGRQVRRTRERVLGTLERVFEQLDLLRFDSLPMPAELPVRVAAPLAPPVLAAPPPAPPTLAPAPLAARAPRLPAELVDYQAAARLAARGAPLAEIAERCGVVAGEARVLMALQRGAAQRAGGAR